MAHITPAPLMSALTNASRQNNAELGPVEKEPIRFFSRGVSLCKCFRYLILSANLRKPDTMNFQPTSNAGRPGGKMTIEISYTIDFTYADYDFLT